MRPGGGPLLALTMAICVLAPSGAHTAEPASEDIVARFEEALDGIRARHDLPGATAAFVLADGRRGAAASGFADLEASAPMTPGTRMLAASIGKTFVGMTLVALAEEGRLDLDARLSDWLGARDWFDRLPNHETATLRHLLNHTAGLPDHVRSDRFAAAVSGDEDRAAPVPEDLVAYVLDQPPVFPAGDGWAYSDTGYILLGLVIEAATGRSFYDEVDARFLSPLGLTATAPSNRRLLEGLAVGYVGEDNPFGFPRRTADSGGVMVWDPAIEWTGGGFASSAVDLASWGHALFTGTAMAGDYLDEVLNAAPLGPAAPRTAYGAGVAIEQNGPFGTTYGHGGWIPGYVSSLRHYADHAVTIAFQINTDIGLVGPAPVTAEIEAALARVVLSDEQASPAP